MFTVVTQYSVTGKRGGYVLQWVGPNKPSYIIGPKGTCHWYRFKSDAASSCIALNK